MKIAIVSTGIANTASVVAALERAGGKPYLTSAAREVSTAPYLVLPGVGAFGTGMAMIEQAGLVDAIQDRIEHLRPTLAICLGMQLLCNASVESMGARGLAVLPVSVSRLPAEKRVPQMGWNRVEPGSGAELIEPGYAYFANSYAIDVTAQLTGWIPSTTEYGVTFLSALERGPVLACQFHPELSGRWGSALISRWMRRGAQC